MRALLGVALLAGCGYSYPAPSVADRAVIDDAVAQYADLRRDTTACDPGELQIYQPPDPDVFLDVCVGFARGSCVEGYRCLDGCFVPEPTQISPTTGPSIIIAGLVPEGRRQVVIAHETMHWLQLCSTGDGDAGHADPLVWAPMGVLTQTEAWILYER